MKAEEKDKSDKSTTYAFYFLIGLLGIGFLFIIGYILIALI